MKFVVKYRTRAGNSRTVDIEAQDRLDMYKQVSDYTDFSKILHEVSDDDIKLAKFCWPHYKHNA